MFGLRKVIKAFERGNCMVCGLRGTGKDMLMSNVVVRRKKPYISNIDYGGEHIPIDFDALNVGGNKYDNFIEGRIKRYVYPYPDGIDIYVSDAGVYFPAQYCGELNKRYAHLAVFQALSRHLGECNFHTNAQYIGRVWDKIREQSETYIKTNRCWVLFGRLVVQQITLYERYEACASNLPPCAIKIPLMGDKTAIMMAKTYVDRYTATNGEIKRKWLVYVNKSSYDTRRFKKILEEGKEIEK